MQYNLVLFKDNWIDEMSVEGFLVLPSIEWQEMIKKARAYFDAGGSYCFYFGTNCEIEYDSFNKFIPRFKVKEIPEREARSIIALFDSQDKKRIQYGVFPEFYFTQDEENIEQDD